MADKRCEIMMTVWLPASSRAAEMIAASLSASMLLVASSKM